MEQIKSLYTNWKYKKESKILNPFLSIQTCISMHICANVCMQACTHLRIYANTHVGLCKCALSIKYIASPRQKSEWRMRDSTGLQSEPSAHEQEMKTDIHPDDTLRTRYAWGRVPCRQSTMYGNCVCGNYLCGNCVHSNCVHGNCVYGNCVG